MRCMPWSGTISGQSVRYIVERMAPRLFGEQERAFFVDSGLTYEGRRPTRSAAWRTSKLHGVDPGRRRGASARVVSAGRCSSTH